MICCANHAHWHGKRDKLCCWAALHVIQKDYFKTQNYDLLRQLGLVTRTDTDTSNCWAAQASQAAGDHYNTLWPVIRCEMSAAQTPWSHKRLFNIYFVLCAIQLHWLCWHKALWCSLWMGPSSSRAGQCHGFNVFPITGAASVSHTDLVSHCFRKLGFYMRGKNWKV